MQYRTSQIQEMYKYMPTYKIRYQTDRQDINNESMLYYSRESIGLTLVI